MTFLIEFKRIFLHQWHSKSLLTIFVFPAVVALLIFIAFLWRSNVSANNEYLIFFTTLYAFWIGLFSSCQLLNGELSSGEWSYWVLGFKRPFFSHLVALVVSSIIITFLQISVLVFTICILDWGYGMNSLYNIYVAKSDLSILSLNLILFNSLTIFPILIFATSVLFAGLSGIGIGTLFSSILKDPSNSLKVAIAFIVIVLISSYTVVKEDNVSRFNPVYITMKQDRSLSALKNRMDYAEKAKGVNMNYGPILLEDLSYLFPQRYFYNLGRVFNRDIISPEDNHKTNEIENKYTCQCVKHCLGEFIPEFKESYMLLKSDSSSISENLKAGKIKLNEVRKLYMLTALYEMLILLAYFSICIFISYLIISKSRKYYELR